MTQQSDAVVIALAILAFLTTLATLVVGAYVAIKTNKTAAIVDTTHALVNNQTTVAKNLALTERNLAVAAAHTAGVVEGSTGVPAPPPIEIPYTKPPTST